MPLRSRALFLFAGLLGGPPFALAQEFSEILTVQPGGIGEGWRGFTDIGFLADALLTLTLAAALGAAIGFHPRSMQAADTLDEIDAPKVCITYAVIGAIIGIMVLKYGLVVGFVVFGIGGLIRFRTVMRSASLTGHVIFVTLIGLSCGLQLPHVAVLATLFGFVLFYLLESRVIFKIDVKALPNDAFPAAVAAYRQALDRHRCRILREKKDPAQTRVIFLFRGPRNLTRDTLDRSLATDIEPELRGSVDWEID